MRCLCGTFFVISAGYFIQRRLFSLEDSVRFIHRRRSQMELSDNHLCQLIHMEEMMEFNREYPKPIPGSSHQENSEPLKELIQRIYSTKDKFEDARRNRLGGKANFNEIVENVYIGDCNAGREV